MSRQSSLSERLRITWDYYSKEYDALESEKNGLKAIIIEPESDYSSVESLLQKDFLAIYHSLAEENRRTFWRNIIQQIPKVGLYRINYVDFVQSVSVFRCGYVFRILQRKSLPNMLSPFGADKTMTAVLSTRRIWIHGL